MNERKRRFSERVGESVVPLQIRSMNAPLRNSLWNLIRTVIPPDETPEYRREKLSVPLVTAITVNVLRLPVEQIESYPRSWLYRLLDLLPWHTVYDILEFLPNNPLPSGRLWGGTTPDEFRKKANEILEAENAAYRFVGGEFSEMTSPTEAATVEEALHQAEAYGLGPAREHLQQSLVLLGKRPEPDYRNAIKEAISAVEAAAKLIAKERKGTLDDALDLLAQRLALHGAFTSGLSKLYGFTSDGGGIRHALLDEPTVNGADARFFVVACAAFVSWLITKADEAGLLTSP